MKRLVSLLSIGSFLFFAVLGIATPALAQTQVSGFSSHHICSAAAAGSAACNAIQVDRTIKGVAPNASSPSGFNPADLQSAYKLPSATAGGGQTVAIVDAYDDPNAETDLAVYRVVLQKILS